MKNLQVVTHPQVDEIFANYPKVVRDQMRFLRALVRETAEGTQGIDQLEETLKWGEPSFVTQYGSTLRMDWKSRSPNQYALYFQCTTRLVETFKMIFGDTFEYEGNRAIVFRLEDDIPKAPLKACIRATLQYHKVKKLITLGI